MGICHNCSTLDPTPEAIVRQKINRRTLMKATTAFTAAAATVGVRPARKSSAQAVPTLAQVWEQPANIGGENGYFGFEGEFPFYALAPHWPSETGFDATVEVQTSLDGATWSDPVVIGPAHTDAGPADRDNRIFGQLAFTDESKFVRYRTLNADGLEQGIAGLQFTYIDATGGPGLDDISTESPIPDLQRPPIISREEWGAHLTYGGAERGASDWIPEYQSVEHVIIHHAETTNFRDPLSEIRSIHYYHAVTRGWGDIGYNYLVDFMGNVYEGRVGGDDVVGGHAYQYAYGSSGICAMGSFTIAEATPEMLAGLIWIVAWAGRYLDPLARADFHEQPNLPTICGHRDVNDSTCPGDGLYADLEYIREAVAQVHAGARETIPNPEYSPGQVIATSVDEANLRDQPGTDAGIVASLPHGTLLQVIEGPTTVGVHHWYHVRAESYDGWLATTTFAPSDAAPPAGSFAIGDVVFTRSDLVNIRENPSLKGLIVQTLPFMTQSTVVDGPMPANGYTWYKVETNLGTGWITERYLGFEADIAMPVRFVVGDAVQVADPAGVRLRATPSADAPSMASMSPGERGSIVDGPVTGDGYAWMKVQTSHGTGWMAETYLDAAPDAGDLKSSFAVGDSVVVDTDSLNLRDQPTATASIIGTLGTAQTATIIGGPEQANNLLWVKLETPVGEGWAVESFLAASGEVSTDAAFQAGSAVYVTTDAVNLRESASLNAAIVATVPHATNGTIADGPQSADGHTWYQIATADGTGWGSAQFFGKGSADPSTGEALKIASTVTSNDGEINVRSDATTSGELLGTLGEGDLATIIAGPVSADGYTWFKIHTPEIEGWCARNWLQRTDSATFPAGATVRVFDGDLNLRAAGSLGAEVVAILPDATFAEVLEGPLDADGEAWYRVSSSAYGTGWASGTWITST